MLLRSAPQAGSQRIKKTLPGKGSESPGRVSWAQTVLSYSLLGGSDPAGKLGQVSVLGQESLVAYPLCTGVGRAAPKGGSIAYPHICPSHSSKLQKGDSPRRKSSRGKCSNHT